MEPLWSLLYLLEPCSLGLLATAVLVVWISAHRALSYEKEAQRQRERYERDSCSSSEPPPDSRILTVDGTFAVIMPIASSCSLLLMFYLFASVSQLIAIATAAVAVSSLAFFIAPSVTWFFSGSSSGRTDRATVVLVVVTTVTMVLWSVTGHWLLNDLLGVAICVAFVTHIRIPNVKVCTLLLSCLFFYDIFWVFFSERLFGANVMVSVATQQASNPVHTVVDKLNLPGLDSITKKLDMPVKILVPRYLFGGSVPGTNDFMMLGLGDMAIPGMLLALVLCFDYKKERMGLDSSLKNNWRSKYSLYALGGYAIGLVCALAAGLLTRMAQPALLYLVPSTLGPVVFLSWLRGDFRELWSGPLINDLKMQALEMV